MTVKSVSVIITTFNDDKYLDKLFVDLANQNLNGISLEILHLEAGTYDKQRALDYLGPLGDSFRYFNVPELGRTKSLNKLMDAAHGELVIRLDARTHIPSDYVQRIVELSRKSGAENVGGVMWPIGETPGQRFIAEIMRSPICLGGAKFRDDKYEGEVDSVYLGAFNTKKIRLGYWFDDNGRISEDSDLNYRIKQSGGRVVVDSGIVVEYFPREGMSSFLKLCFNYGVGRGIFVLKHKKFSALRQIIPPAFFLLSLVIFGAGFFDSIFFEIFFGLIFCYIFCLSLAGFFSRKPPRELFKFVTAISGCHIFWSLGLFLSPLYKRT